MKNFLAGITLLFFVTQIHAATTYTVSANTSWNGTYPGYCNTCTFNISSGITLTLNTNATCYNCTINGGTVNLSSDFTFQQSAFQNTIVTISGKKLDLQNNGTSFSNTTVNASGTSNFYASGSLSVSGSTFNFSGTSEFGNAGGQLDISASYFYFYGNSDFNATAGPINLKAGSQIYAGDGSIPSKAFLLFNGPTLNIADAGSAIYVTNVNNYYANWSAYNSTSNSKTYTTTSNNKNCGGSGQNACTAQKFFGCGSFSSMGPVTCSTLAEPISDFKAVLTNGGIKINWTISDMTQNAQITIEHSSDAIHFTPLTTMPAGIPDAGYTFTDFSPMPGENDYRISLMQADGKINVSKIVSVQNTGLAEISVYPNPATGGRFFIQVQ